MTSAFAAQLVEAGNQRVGCGVLDAPQHWSESLRRQAEANGLSAAYIHVFSKPCFNKILARDRTKWGVLALSENIASTAFDTNNSGITAMVPHPFKRLFAAFCETLRHGSVLIQFFSPRDERGELAPHPEQQGCGDGDAEADRGGHAARSRIMAFAASSVRLSVGCVPASIREIDAWFMPNASASSAWVIPSALRMSAIVSIAAICLAHSGIVNR